MGVLHCLLDVQELGRARCLDAATRRCSSAYPFFSSIPICASIRARAASVPIPAHQAFQLLLLRTVRVSATTNQQRHHAPIHNHNLTHPPVDPALDQQRHIQDNPRLTPPPAPHHLQHLRDEVSAFIVCRGCSKTRKNREDVMKQNVHIMSTAGIAGNITEGAYSIVLSSGYTDNVDNGEVMYVLSCDCTNGTHV